MNSRALFGVAVCLALANGPLLAHDPHDPIVTVAVSPNFAQDSTAFAATDYLSIKLGVYALLESTDGGVTWWPVAGLPNVREMWAVVFSPAYSQDQTIFVAGYGGLYVTTNQGASWTLSSTLSLNSVALSPNFAVDNTLFIVTSQMAVFESTNRGQTFTQLTLPVSLTSAPTVIAVSPNFDVDGTLLLGSASDGIFQSTDAGATWVSVSTTQPSPPVNGLAFSPGFSSDQTAFAATNSGVLISTDGGNTWAASNAGLSDTNVNSITLSPNYLQDATLWVATAVGGVFESTNQGAAWAAAPLINRELSPLTTSHYHNVAAANGASGITLMLATYEGLWTSPATSISWQYIDTMPTRLVRHMPISPNFANDQTLFANTYGGGNLWTTTGGASWVFQNTGMRLPYTDAAAISSNFANDQTAWSATNDVLERTVNGGATWTSMAALGAHTHVRGLAVSPTFAHDATVLIGTDNEPAATYPPYVTYQGNQYPNQGLFLSTNGGKNWIPTSLGGPPVDSIAISPGFATDQTAFAASSSSGLYKSTDGGMTWTSIPLPDSIIKLGIVTLSPAFTTDQVVYVVPTTGGILKSTNGGSTWSSLTRIQHLVVLDLQLSPNYAVDHTFFAATLQSGVMKSTNGGNALLPLSGFPDSFVTALAISPNFTNDQTVFAAAYHSIFKSVNGGSSWTDMIEPARIEESRTVDSNTSGQPPPTITYQGSWSSTSSASASTEAVMTTTSSQNTAAINFTGTGIRWISQTGPKQGSATILLDGVSQGTITLNAPTNQFQQVVWQQQGLPCAPHTVTISATPQHGQAVTLDAFDMWINACPGAGPNQHSH
jgi:photosystem II stability/assembly factor-like uncharacterized protein